MVEEKKIYSPERFEDSVLIDRPFWGLLNIDLYFSEWKQDLWSFPWRKTETSQANDINMRSKNLANEEINTALRLQKMALTPWGRFAWSVQAYVITTLVWDNTYRLEERFLPQKHWVNG